MGVLENFPGVVEEVAFNPDRILREAGDEKYRLFLLRLAPVVRARSNKQTHPTHCDRWQFNGVTLHVLHPAGADRLEALARGMRNGGSLIVAEYEGTRLLCALVGLDGRLVEVEVDLGPGLPAFNVVGLPDGRGDPGGTGAGPGGDPQLGLRVPEQASLPMLNTASWTKGSSGP